MQDGITLGKGQTKCHVKQRLAARQAVRQAVAWCRRRLERWADRRELGPRRVKTSTPGTCHSFAPDKIIGVLEGIRKGPWNLSAVSLAGLRRLRGGKPRKRVTHNESNFVVCLRSTVRFLLAFLSASGLLWYFWLRTGGALSFRGAASETFCLFYSPYSGLFVRRFFSGFVTKRGLIGVESFMRHRVLGYVSSRLLHYITFATVAVIYFRLFKRSV